jgi:hypothetical protein
MSFYIKLLQPFFFIDPLIHRNAPAESNDKHPRCVLLNKRQLLPLNLPSNQEQQHGDVMILQFVTGVLPSSEVGDIAHSAVLSQTRD